MHSANERKHTPTQIQNNRLQHSKVYPPILVNNSVDDLNLLIRGEVLAKRKNKHSI